jgi:N-acetylmuramoyl-L-alanine amidase
VPTRLLLEICNLGNSDDRKMMTTRAWRQKVAEAIYEGLVSFYADRSGHRSSGVTTAAN